MLIVAKVISPLWGHCLKKFIIFSAMTEKAETFSVKNSSTDFFGIMTSYQECCIYAVSLKKGRDNMEYFLLNSVFFKRYNSGKKSG